MRVTTVFISVCILFFAVSVRAQIHDERALIANPEEAVQPIAPILKGLGNYHFAVTTKSPESQQFFDQGLRLTYAFNHSEALRSFKEAVRLDPGNAMAYWGWALVLGPNLNLPMLNNVNTQAYLAIQHAVSLKNNVSDRERGYIEALAERYAKEPPSDRSSLDQTYAHAMGKLAKQYPDDNDAATLYAASLMNLSPWDYWTMDGSPRGHTETILRTLQSVIDHNPEHVGALHYYIHAVEARHPEWGEKYADMLVGLMPGAGHIVHMPSHIYMRVGRYADAYEANRRAVMADERYITQCSAQGLYPLGYYPHNIHFMVWAAMMQGRSEAALEAARKIVDKIPPDLVADKNVWALYETFLSQPLFVMVRFGMWDRLLAEPKPDYNSLFITGIWHYGRALAFIHKNRLMDARSEHKQLSSLRAAMSQSDYYIGYGTAENLLTIAEEIVSGELKHVEGKTLEGLAHMERAVRLEDGLRYDEPPDWYFPVRHYLGAMLLDAGWPNEAEVIYLADLRKNPGNGYSLFGLKKALEKQDKLEDAKTVGKRFNQAWADASHILISSRY